MKNARKLALHAWTLDTTPLADFLRVARETGWDAVELRRLDFTRAAEHGESASAMIDLVKGSGLPVACVGVAYGQYSAVPRTGLEPGKALDRLPPGRGQVPFKEIFGVIAAKGYAGFMSYEAPNPAAWARSAAEVAREALTATLAVLP